MQTREIEIGSITIGGRNPLVFIAGPCVIESEEITLSIASKLKDYSEQHNIPLIFKSSYDKANRTSVNSYRGPGIDEGLRILQKVKKEINLPLLSDIHTVDEITKFSEVLDVIQIPAFLCRQTDIIVTAAMTGKPVNVKKGQFLSPYDVKNIIDKVRSTGNENIMITERGASFGYNNLVVDMRVIPIMRSFGYPVVYDATHSVQLPGGQGTASGGDRQFVAPLARAAVAAGIDALFLEVHENPDAALCDGPNSVLMSDLPELLRHIMNIYTAGKR